ncbi:DNA helicase PcrA [Anaeroselena agilis]|uniref:ATP-dependent DNA helicase n=1 Tax=Anaeroselena agilis TaxID=3063788 RepID=A0ABU3NTS4_9FIRM|nr:DNA helicase PcrA [Selenomonadales bacterium 4137-cl]
MPKILDKLNPAQLEAATHLNGPLLVIAGAGSGKTRVLTARIAHLLEQGVPPYAILAITFTNKAAAEMKERVYRMVGPQAKDIWLSTFHAFCAKFLRIEAERLPGLTKSFVIYDAGDSLALVKGCLKELNLDDKHFPPAGVQAAISNAKNSLLDPGAFAREADNFHQHKVAEVYDLYQRKLRHHNAVDFDDLLFLSARLLATDQEVLAKYQDKFRYILIDEYQDTNRAQYMLARHLAAKHRNIFVVGDVDQSIYAWRGADIRNILDFEADYPEARVIKLEQNYRSTQTILDAANTVIENNRDRKPKTLWTDNPAGERLTHYLAVDERDEARFVCDNVIKQNTVYRVPYRDMAVLYRTNAQSRVIEEAFMRAGVPYTIVGGLKFYDRKEIKDILAYLRVIFNPADAVGLQRIINVPRRGIGDTTVGRLSDYAAERGVTLFDAVSGADAVPGLTSRARNQLDGLAALIFGFTAKAPALPVYKLIETVMNDSGYLAELENEQTPQAEARIENLRELLSVAKEFAAGEIEDTLENFLSHVALVSDVDAADTDGDKVTLMTLHSAKGLEFPVVFLAGLEEGIFPHSRTLMNDDEVEEERRLCYVGITRAQRKLFITNAKMRTIYGNTVMYPSSRFLQEIPEALVEKHNVKRDRYSQALTPAPTPSPLRTPVAPTLKTDRPAGNWRAGDKVEHAKWGVGTIVEVRGEGDGQEVKVAFPGMGIRQLMAKFAPLKKVQE